MELPFQHQSLELLYKTCSVQRPCLDGKENRQVPADLSRIHLGTLAPKDLPLSSETSSWFRPSFKFMEATWHKM